MPTYGERIVERICRSCGTRYYGSDPLDCPDCCYASE